MNNKSRKRTFYKLIAFLFLSVLLFMFLIAFVPVAECVTLPSVYKDIPKEYATPVVPNVLLLLDTSGSMLFDESGKFTKGDGGRPYDGDGNGLQVYYGIDTVKSNNDPDDMYSYYPPLKYLDDKDKTVLGTERLNYMSTHGDGKGNYLAKNDDQYLYPNDSRLYKLKLVLWNIFSDPSLISGLNVGLATYYQERKYGDPGYTYSYYAFEKYKKWDAWPALWHWDWQCEDPQKISWQPTGENRALLRLPFGVVPSFFYSDVDFKSGVPAGKEDDNHWYRILSFIDGKESSLNPEIRAIGGTPLEKSIYNEDSGPKYMLDPEGEILYLELPIKQYVSMPSDLTWVQITASNSGQIYRYKIDTKNNSVFRSKKKKNSWGKQKYLSPLTDHRYIFSDGTCAASFIKSQIKYPCQQNWLIVLTDGADSSSSADPAEAVQKLYRANRDLSDWPRPYSSQAQPVKTFVIGFVKEGSSLSSTLEDMADEGKALGDSDEENHAFYANDTASLLESFRSIFRTIQGSKSSSIPPSISSNGLSESDVYSYASSFSPELEGAWPGYLYKKKTVKNDITGKYETTTEWAARDKLITKGWENRSIYYLPWWNGMGGSLLKLGVNNSIDSEICNHAGIPSEDSFSFISWIRGSNWGENSTRDNILFDNYRGDMVLVGAPPGYRNDEAFNKFAFDNRERIKILYYQGNDGMLHAFNDGDGRELWAFIPPNVLHSSRIAGLQKNAENPNKGTSRYLLAGPVVVEDVFDSEYKTVLLGSLGYGGTGLYALNISGADKKPEFIWALDSTVYSGDKFNDASDNINILWNKGIQSPSSAKWNIPELRHVIGRPFIGWVLKDDEVKWIALFGAGYGDKLIDVDGNVFFKDKKDKGGRAIYAISMKDSSKIKGFTDKDMGEVVASISVPGQSSILNYLKVSSGYVGDSKGNIWKISLDGSDANDWNLSCLIKLKKKSDKMAPSIQYSVELSKYNTQKWIFAGTGNADGLFVSSFDIRPDNCIVGFKEPDSQISRSDLVTLDKDSSDDDDDGVYVDDPSEHGWCIDLGINNQVTTVPVISKGFLFLATYEKKGDNPCNPGMADLYRLNAFTGRGQWASGSKYGSMKGIKITSLAVAADKLYAGILNPAGKKIDDFDLPDGSTLDAEGALLTIPLPELSDSSGITSDDLNFKSSYWRRLKW